MTALDEALVLARLNGWIRSGAARGARVAAGLSLSRAGKAAGGVSPSTVLRWERGERHPRGDAAVRYAVLIEELIRQ